MQPMLLQVMAGADCVALSHLEYPGSSRLARWESRVERDARSESQLPSGFRHFFPFLGQVPL